MRIGICIITCKRLDGLKRLLESLDTLIFVKSQEPDISIIVVDNDATGSARIICETTESKHKWTVFYDIEPQRGIPFARNRCLNIATKHNDCIAFIDDDEVAEPTWLDELIFIYNKFEANIVAGPVLPYFNTPPPEWIITGNFFDLPRFKTGYTPVKFPGTGNVIINCEVITKTEVSFDERLALTGGSDTHFFMKLYLASYEAMWADEAIVREWVPETRTNAKWIILRAFRVGSNLAFVEIDAYKSYFSLDIITRLLKAIRRILLGILLFPFCIFLGRRYCITALQFISKGIGMIAGLFSISYDEYKTIHKV